MNPTIVRVKVQRTSHIVNANVTTQITVGGKLPYYEGDYVVIPKTVDQNLATENKSMRKDVTVKEIPVESVSNPQGGRTISIGCY